MRHLQVCSVDPPGCRDIDDALHVRVLKKDNHHDEHKHKHKHDDDDDDDDDSVVWEVGVHIADVSYFVKPGSFVDAEAAKRSTTTYLVQRRIDMLPKALTGDMQLKRERRATRVQCAVARAA